MKRKEWNKGKIGRRKGGKERRRIERKKKILKSINTQRKNPLIVMDY